MGNDDALFRFQVGVFALAEELGNARAACRVVAQFARVYIGPVGMDNRLEKWGAISSFVAVLVILSPMVFHETAENLFLLGIFLFYGGWVWYLIRRDIRERQEAKQAKERADRAEAREQEAHAWEQEKRHRLEALGRKVWENRDLIQRTSSQESKKLLQEVSEALGDVRFPAEGQQAREFVTGELANVTNPGMTDYDRGYRADKVLDQTWYCHTCGWDRRGSRSR